MYAYFYEDDFYPIITVQSRIDVVDTGFNTIYSRVFDPDSDGIYNLKNGLLENIRHIGWYSPESTDQFIFPYNPSEYDYYIIGALDAICADISLSTFLPMELVVYYDQHEMYELSNFEIHELDSRFSLGFGFSAKVHFDLAGSTAIDSVFFVNDQLDSGVLPPDLMLQLGIMAVEKGTDENAINQQILNKLDEMNGNIVSGFDQVTDSVQNAADQVADAIENQYGMVSGEDFGVQDLTSQVEEKLGVLSFGADTLNNFLGLFQASNAGSTVLTFPGFTIDVQGESYKVWNDIKFDLSFLEENFGILITAVRTVTVLCVWLAVLGYLVKAYEHLINNKGWSE